MYCENWVIFGTKKTEEYFFKFIYCKCTPFLNRAWMKRWIKSFVSSRKSLDHLIWLADLVWYSSPLHWLKYDWKYEGKSPFTILWKKNILQDHLLSSRDSKSISWSRLSRDVPLITPVTTIAARYWIVFNLVLKDSLKGLSKIISA